MIFFQSFAFFITDKRSNADDNYAEKHRGQSETTPIEHYIELYPDQAEDQAYDGIDEPKRKDGVDDDLEAIDENV